MVFFYACCTELRDGNLTSCSVAVLSNTDNELLSKDLGRAARELSDAPSVTCDTTYAKKKLAPTSRPL